MSRPVRHAHRHAGAISRGLLLGLGLGGGTLGIAAVVVVGLIARQSRQDARAEPPAPPLPRVPSTTSVEKAPRTGPPTLADLPPPVRLGTRAASTQARLGTRDVVVLAPDTAGVVQAMRGWTVTDAGAVRYPILIDDGSYAAQQRVMRFVRAFKPARVLRLGDAAAATQALPERTDSAGRESLTRALVAGAWGVKDYGGLSERWRGLSYVPPGLVVTWTSDSAWLAGVALAAGRGQPIAFVAPPGNGGSPMGGIMNLAEARGYGKGILEQTARIGEEFGVKHEALGDDLDALTLAATTPARVLMPEGDKRGILALTDLVTRPNPSADGWDRSRTRWAFAGQVAGFGGSAKDQEAQALYLAMSGMFLPEPERAWLFDGYDSSPGWNAFDASAAGDELANTPLKFDRTVDDRAGGKGLDEWRDRVAGLGDGGASTGGYGIDAGLITVTTSGQPGSFDLKPGTGLSIDVPILRRPSAVYFVHSFSAANLSSRDTIGGMWLERGASVYCGSVHEPFLQAFVPTPMFARRVGHLMPISASMRIDEAEPWKLTFVGDPLLTFGPSLDRVPMTEAEMNGPLSGPLAGARDVLSVVPALLKADDYASAIRALALGGRERDAVRLFVAARRDKPAAVGPDAGLAVMSSAFALGEQAVLVDALRLVTPVVLDPARGDLAELRDTAWHALRPVMGTLSNDELDLLSKFMRPASLVRDARELVRSAGLGGGAVDPRWSGGASKAAPSRLTPGDILARARSLSNDQAVLKQLDQLRP
jgi:hypothetical protein